MTPTSSRNLLRSLRYSVLLAALLMPADLFAQIVEGVVVDSVRGTPVGKGFVVLLDQHGNERARSLAGPDGRFSLQAPAGGRYSLRSERIGFRTVTSGFLLLGDEETVDHRLVVSALPIRLETIIVPGHERCNTNPEEGEHTLLVWEEVRKALAATVWGDEQELFRYKKYTYRREFNERRNRMLSEVGTSKVELSEPPFNSLPPEHLARVGYIAQRGGDTWYFLPDARTILHDDFLDTHCFHVVRGEKDRPSQVGLAFRPTDERRLPDVEGTLWLDERSSELLELEVRHTRVSYEVRDRRIGGNVRFLMLPSGAWIVREWELRTPRITVTEHPRYPRGYKGEVVGFTDTGGEIYELADREGNAVYEAAVARAEGTVYDSTIAGPLVAAIVSVAGTNIHALTDSTGIFRLSAPLTGQHTLKVDHPFLDSIAAPAQEQTVEFVRDRGTATTVPEPVNFAIPHAGSHLRQLCDDDELPGESRVVLGIVRDYSTGEPAPGASVSAAWQAFRVRQAGSGSQLAVSVHELKEEVKTDESGFYFICDVPSGIPIRIVAEKDGKISREASLMLAEQEGDIVEFGWDREPGGSWERQHRSSLPAWRVEFDLGDPRAEPVERGLPVLYGTVSDSITGSTVAGATVLVNGTHRTITHADGTYRIPDVIWQDDGNSFEFSRIGYSPARVVARVGEMLGEFHLNASLPPLAIQLAEVVVEGVRTQVPRVLKGFYQRREVGIGEFYTEEDWERYPEFTVAEVLERFPGLTVSDWRVLVANAAFTCRSSGVSARIWVNGVSVHRGFIQTINIDDVSAIEVYRRIADIPVQYNSSADQAAPKGSPFSSAACGVILIWTK